MPAHGEPLNGDPSVAIRSTCQGETVARQCQRDDHATQTVPDEVNLACAGSGEHVLHGLDEPGDEVVDR